MWLVPFDPQKPASVYVFFDHPIQLSMIKIYGYSKSPERSVQHMQVYMDDSLILDTAVRKPPAAKGVLSLFS